MNFQRLWPIFIVVFVDILGYTIIIPILPFLAQSLGASEIIFGLLVSSFAIAQFIAGPILGHLSDKLGRKPVLVISQIGTLLSFLMMAYTKRLEFLFLARILDGLTSGNLVVASAAISDVTPKDQRFRAFGLIGIAFGMGFFIGPMISGFFAHKGFQVPALIAAFLSFISILLTIFIYKETLLTRSQSSKLEIFPINDFLKMSREPKIFRLLQSFFYFNLAFTGMIVGVPLVLQKKVEWFGVPFSASHVGWLYSYLGLLGIIVQTKLLHFAVKHHGEEKVARYGAIFQGVGIATYGFVEKFLTAFAGSTLSNVGAGFVRSTTNSLLTQKVGPEYQGQIIGISQSVASIAGILAPILTGWFMSMDTIWAYGVFFGIVASLGFWTSKSND